MSKFRTVHHTIIRNTSRSSSKLRCFSSAQGATISSARDTSSTSSSSECSYLSDILGEEHPEVVKEVQTRPSIAKNSFASSSMQHQDDRTRTIPDLNTSNSSSSDTTVSGADSLTNDASEKTVSPVTEEIYGLFGDLRSQAMSKLQDFSAVHLFSLSWAFATAGLLDDELYRHIRKHILRLGQKKDAAELKDRSSPLSSRERKEGETVGHEKNLLIKPLTILNETCDWMVLDKTIEFKVNQHGDGRNDWDTTDEISDEKSDGKSSHRKIPSVHHFIRRNYPGVCTRPDFGYGILHRLDLETSGALICAKTFSAYYWLRLQWCALRVQKEYLLLVHGHVDKNLTECRERIKSVKRVTKNGTRTCVSQIDRKGKPARTGVDTIGWLWLNDDADRIPVSLVKCKLYTGRTHQIRVHMAQALGYPLFCDKKYGSEFYEQDVNVWRNTINSYVQNSDDSSPDDIHASVNQTLHHGRTFLHHYSLKFARMPKSMSEEVSLEVSAGAVPEGSTANATEKKQGKIPNVVAADEEMQTVIAPLSPELKILLKQAECYDEDTKSRIGAYL